MKLFAIICALLAGVSALPKLEVENAIRQGDERLITGSIASAIEDISQAIIDAGLDPLIIESVELDYALPVPSIFNVRSYLKNLLFQGASNIVINQLNVNLITMRVTFNIALPEILLNVVDSEIDANLFGKNLNGKYSGRFALRNIQTTGDIRVSVGIISGVSIRSIALTFKIGEIDSQLNLWLQGNNYSNALNTYLGDTIPKTLNDYEDDINNLLTIVGKEVIESML